MTDDTIEYALEDQILVLKDYIETELKLADEEADSTAFETLLMAERRLFGHIENDPIAYPLSAKFVHKTLWAPYKKERAELRDGDF